LNPPIIATKVPDNRRMRFLPDHFGPRHMLQGEGLVYAWAANLIVGYSGGYWEFFELSNGGFYMVPKTDDVQNVIAPNMFCGALSAEAAGIVATLYGLCQIANSTEEDHLIEKYHALREFALTHAEGEAILCAID
jgi:hypothetical protein